MKRTRYVRRILADDQDTKEVDSSELDQSENETTDIETQLESPFMDSKLSAALVTAGIEQALHEAYKKYLLTRRMR
ncbi:MAG: hypothetical protein F4W92_01230 [Gammaproteobacteria bacterium]|nr:hypothetical protein [Gammaproteobacteria bacterium]